MKTVNGPLTSPLIWPAGWPYTTPIVAQVDRIVRLTYTVNNVVEDRGNWILVARYGLDRKVHVGPAIKFTGRETAYATILHAIHELDIGSPTEGEILAVAMPLDRNSIQRCLNQDWRTS